MQVKTNELKVRYFNMEASRKANDQQWKKQVIEFCVSFDTIYVNLKTTHTKQYHLVLDTAVCFRRLK